MKQFKPTLTLRCDTTTVHRSVSTVPEASPVKVLKEGEEEVTSHRVELIGATC